MSNKKESIYRKIYEELCEYCHPNFWGITMGSHINKIAIARFDKSPKLFKESLFIFYYMNISLSSFIRIYDKILELLTENEELPIKLV